MTSSEAAARIGSRVFEACVGESATLREVRRTQWDDAEQSRSVWMALLEYPGLTRWVPLSAVKVDRGRKLSVPAPPAVGHNLFLRNVRAVLAAGPPCLSASPVTLYGLDEAASRLFAGVFDRLPTAAEVEYMSGGDPPRCAACGCQPRREFRPNGTPIDRCQACQGGV